MGQLIGGGLANSNSIVVSDATAQMLAGESGTLQEFIEAIDSRLDDLGGSKPIFDDLTNYPEFFVDILNGDDNNDGYSESTAFASLEKVQSILKSFDFNFNDVIIYLKGTISNKFLSFDGNDITNIYSLTIQNYNGNLTETIFDYSTFRFSNFKVSIRLQDFILQEQSKIICDFCSDYYITSYQLKNLSFYGVKSFFQFNFSRGTCTNFSLGSNINITNNQSLFSVNYGYLNFFGTSNNFNGYSLAVSYLFVGENCSINHGINATFTFTGAYYSFSGLSDILPNNLASNQNGFSFLQTVGQLTVKSTVDAPPGLGGGSITSLGGLRVAKRSNLLGGGSLDGNWSIGRGSRQDVSDARLQVTGGVLITNDFVAGPDPGAGNLSVTGNLSLGTPLSLVNGGTGSTTASTARSNLQISAANTPYVNSTSGLAATNTQTAIDEVAARTNVAAVNVVETTLRTTTSTTLVNVGAPISITKPTGEGAKFTSWYLSLAFYTNNSNNGKIQRGNFSIAAPHSKAIANADVATYNKDAGADNYALVFNNNINWTNTTNLSIQPQLATDGNTAEIRRIEIILIPVR